MLFPGIQKKWENRAVRKAKTVSRKNKPESLQVRKRPTKRNKAERKRIFREPFGRDLRRTEKAFVFSSGSLALEAAFVLPLALFFLMTLFGFFTVVSVQVKVQKALENAVSKTAGAAIYETDAVLSSQAVSLWYLEQSVRQALAGTIGLEGMDFEGSEVDWDQAVADVRVTYSIKAATALFPLPSLTMSQRCRRKLWTGVSWGETGEKGEETLVYITEEGTVYHRSAECSYLRLSTKFVNYTDVGGYRNASGEIYRPCELCDPGREEESVYITDTGNRYHKSLTCRGLKRRFWAVPITEVGERGPCSRCGKKDE